MSASSQQLADLYRRFAQGGLTRREFMRQAAALGVAGAAASALGPLEGGHGRGGWPRGAGRRGRCRHQIGARPRRVELHVGERRSCRDGARRFVGGQQMYVEYMIPAQVRHPFPMVLVHGGGGQGTDWMGTPDGRPGWFQILVAGRLQGLRRRSPGPRAFAVASRPARRASRAQAGTLESMSGRFTPPSANPIGSRTVPKQPHPVAGSWQRRFERTSISSSRRRAGATSCSRRLRRGAGARQGGPGSAGPAAVRGAARRPAAGRRTNSRAGPEQRAAPRLAAGGRRSARQDRPCNHHDALGRRPVRPARGRSAARTS